MYPTKRERKRAIVVSVPKDVAQEQQPGTQRKRSDRGDRFQFSEYVDSQSGFESRNAWACDGHAPHRSLRSRCSLRSRLLFLCKPFGLCYVPDALTLNALSYVRDSLSPYPTKEKIMKRFFRIVACVFLMFVACPGVVVSQELNDAFNEFWRGFNNELLSSPEQFQKYVEYMEASSQLIVTSSKNHSEIMQKRLSDSGPNLSQEEILKISEEVGRDVQITLRKSLIEKAKEIYPAEHYQKMEQRQFQIRENAMRRLESLNNYEDVHALMQAENNVYFFGDGQPNFLGLTPEQRDLIISQRKDMAANIWALMDGTARKNPERYAEIRQLTKTFLEIPVEEHGGDEAQRIIAQIMKYETDVTKDAFPGLKKILLKSREDYLRVLTDAQKAKIDAVMNEMPEYMKNLFAEIDRQGGGLSILQLWQPGMGAPDVPNPNREAPRERPQSERAFPE